jgi:hypothetical protein
MITKINHASTRCAFTTFLNNSRDNEVRFKCAQNSNFLGKVSWVMRCNLKQGQTNNKFYFFDIWTE